MTDTADDPQPGDTHWPENYFNYFTEIEEHFQRARGTSLFLLSPLDWALIENWKNAGIPLEAVLRGIDEAFAPGRTRKRHRTVNSVAYCAQAVREAFRRMPDPSRRSNKPADAPFAAADLRRYLEKASRQLEQKPEPVYQELTLSLKMLAEHADEHLLNLEDLERRLTAMEEKMVAAARSVESEESLYSLRQGLDEDLKPYRGKMTADQLSMLERRYLDTAILERAQLPRLSLFYLH